MTVSVTRALNFATFGTIMVSCSDVIWRGRFGLIIAGRIPNIQPFESDGLAISTRHWASLFRKQAGHGAQRGAGNRTVMRHAG